MIIGIIGKKISRLRDSGGGGVEFIADDLEQQPRFILLSCMLHSWCTVMSFCELGSLVSRTDKPPQWFFSTSFCHGAANSAHRVTMTFESRDREKKNGLDSTWRCVTLPIACIVSKLALYVQ